MIDNWNLDHLNS